MDEHRVYTARDVMTRSLITLRPEPGIYEVADHLAEMTPIS